LPRAANPKKETGFCQGTLQGPHTNKHAFIPGEAGHETGFTRIQIAFGEAKSPGGYRMLSVQFSSVCLMWPMNW
jgi:hypothetical protein